LKGNREIKDVVYLMALQGLNYVAPLIVFPYLMKVLGAEKFGYIGFSLSVTQYLMLIVDFGFNLTATKKIAIAKNNQEELNEIFSATLFAKLVLLIISFIILLIVAFAIPRFAVYSSTMMIMFLMVIANTFSFVWLFQGLGKIRQVSIINGISKLLILPLTFVLVRSADDFLFAALIQSMVYIFGSLIVVGVLVKQKFITKWIKSTKEKVLREIKDAFPIFLSSVATSVYVSLFVVLLAYFSTPDEVGKYAAVEKIMRSVCYFIFIPISQVFYPKVSSMAFNNRSEAVILIRKLLIVVAVGMASIFVGMYFFSGILIDFLGDDYRDTKMIFRIMAIIPLFIGMGGILGQLGLLGLGGDLEKKKFQNVYFIAGGVAVVSTFLLTPRFHAIGASVSLLITEFVVFLFMALISKKYLFKNLSHNELLYGASKSPK